MVKNTIWRDGKLLYIMPQHLQTDHDVVANVAYIFEARQEGQETRRRFPPGERERQRDTDIEDCAWCISAVFGRQNKRLNHKSISDCLSVSMGIPSASDTHSHSNSHSHHSQSQSQSRLRAVSKKAGVIYVAICMRYSCTFVAMPPSNESPFLIPSCSPPPNSTATPLQPDSTWILGFGGFLISLFSVNADRNAFLLTDRRMDIPIAET